MTTTTSSEQTTAQKPKSVEYIQSVSRMNIILAALNIVILVVSAWISFNYGLLPSYFWFFALSLTIYDMVWRFLRAKHEQIHGIGSLPFKRPVDRFQKMLLLYAVFYIANLSVIIGFLLDQAQLAYLGWASMIVEIFAAAIDYHIELQRATLWLDQDKNKTG